MAETQALTRKAKAEDVRGFLMKDVVKEQIKMAIPRHMSADRLLRIAFTSIMRTPKLLECSKESLLSCVMTCAQLGLEPDQFLGQAYLVPFKNTKKGIMECQLMPGYRGYIALARRTGEVQSVSSQVVYTKDTFNLTYGLEEKLEHIPTEGDRGEPRGAYVVFHYKDGSRSFDYMSKADIERIRKRSKSANDGPWVTDWDEMAKKTVIKRHVKLAPMSVEFARAASLEDRGLQGVSQSDLLAGGEEEEAPELVGEGKTTGLTSEETQAALAKFTESIPKDVDAVSLNEFLDLTAQANRSDAEGVRVEASKNPDSFWAAYKKWAEKNAPEKKADGPSEEQPGLKMDNKQDGKKGEPKDIYCPNAAKKIKDTACEGCPDREGCPSNPDGKKK